MDADQAKQVLLNKERELRDEIARLRAEGLEARTAEVEDPIDSVISSEGQAAAFQETSLASDTLNAVRDALQRIQEGTYGACIDCGKPIEEARLKAVPWAGYCRADQEKHDREAAGSNPDQLGTLI